MLRQHSAPLWSKIPSHLFQPIPSSSQARYYSSSSEGSDAEQAPSSNDAEQTPPSTLASTFGFQSLSGLFEQPKRGRYSSPREREQEPSDAPAASEDSASAKSGTEQRPRMTEDSTNESKVAKSEDDGRSSTSNVDPVARDAESSQPATSNDVLAAADTYVPPQAVRASAAPRSSKNESSRDETPVVIGEAFRKRFAADDSPRTSNRRREAHRGSSTSRRLAGFRSTVEQDSGIPGEPRRANPFLAVSRRQDARPGDYKRVRPAHVVSPHADKPWGISKEDLASVNSLLEPGTNVNASGREPPRSTDAVRPSAQANASTGNSEADAPGQRAKNVSTHEGEIQTQQSPVSSTAPAKGKLSHVTSSGEAHMVDVGAKQITHRVAVAIAVVSFSTSEPYRLILENNNKKGDVIGVARIAGIMAAKRTADLIPLCHPIAINKVDMDVTLHAPRKATPYDYLPASRHGLIVLQSRVDCNGPTGVEMEALTAVTAAALTVYDMCKAVDKMMTINAAKVVYKSGGRSGTFAHHPWSIAMGSEWFTERGLQVPESVLERYAKVTKSATEDARVSATTEPAKSPPANNEDEAHGSQAAGKPLIRKSSRGFPASRRWSRSRKSASSVEANKLPRSADANSRS